MPCPVHMNEVQGAKLFPLLVLMKSSPGSPCAGPAFTPPCLPRKLCLLDHCPLFSTRSHHVPQKQCQSKKLCVETYMHTTPLLCVTVLPALVSSPLLLVGVSLWQHLQSRSRRPLGQTTPSHVHQPTRWGAGKLPGRNLVPQRS